jgi:RimJ/RimL family protein N-acetyltransferase
MIISGKIVYLRAMELDDMEMYRDMINDDYISQMVVGWSFPVSKKEQFDWYNRVISSENKRFTICLKENDKPVGMVTLTDIDYINRTALHGIKLHPSCPQGKGIATDAVMTLMELAFNQMNLNRLDGSWLVYNTSSKRLYERCGWREEGIKRSAIYRNGEYHDMAISGILKEEFIAAKERLGWDKE